MKIGILGSGIVGRVLGAGFIKHGHQAKIGTRDADKSDLQQWIRETPGLRLRQHYSSESARTSMYALVYSWLFKKPMDTRSQTAHEIEGKYA